MTPVAASALATFSMNNRGEPATTILYVLVGAFYVYLCFRVAQHASRRGRRFAVWFFITLFFTPVPAAVMFVRDWNRTRRAEAMGNGAEDERTEGREDKRMGGREEDASPADSSSSPLVPPSSPPPLLPSPRPAGSAGQHDSLSTCPHCRRLIGPADLDASGGATACPHCGMFIDEAHRA